MCAAAADRGFTWSDEETSLLLRLWGGREAQSGLTGSKRNFAVYEAVSERMGSAGFRRTASQCREKIKRMKREYTLARAAAGRGRRGEKAMRFFEEFHRILHEGRRSGSPPEGGKDPRKLKGIEPRSPPPRIPNIIMQDSTNPWSASAGDDGPPILRDVRSCTPTQDDTEDSDMSKDLRGTQPKLLRDLIDSLSAKFRHHRADSDAKALRQMEQLEKERSAAEERILKMWQEHEARRGEEEKEHELKVMAIFRQIADKVNPEKTI